MNIALIPTGDSPPENINVIIEVPIGGEPVKYEFDTKSGALFVDRILHTPMRYPANYGFVPHTLSGIGMWSLVGVGPWAVELKASGAMVGHCGFFRFERAMIPPLVDEPEMGWIFDPAVHGQGIAFEACSAALGWADNELAADSYAAIIDFENVPSIKLAERLGFVRQGDATYRASEIAVFRRAVKTPRAR